MFKAPLRTNGPTYYKCVSLWFEQHWIIQWKMMNEKGLMNAFHAQAVSEQSSAWVCDPYSSKPTSMLICYMSWFVTFSFHFNVKFIHKLIQIPGCCLAVIWYWHFEVYS